MKEKIENLLSLVNSRINGELLIVDSPLVVDVTIENTPDLINSGIEIGLFYSPEGAVISSPHSKCIFRKRFEYPFNEELVYEQVFTDTIVWMLFGKGVKSKYVDIPCFKDLIKK